AGRREEDKIVVERVNVAKKHQRRTQKSPGGVIEKPVAIFASKVLLVCPRCGKPTRVAAKKVEKKSRRSCRKCGEVIDKL
ncbi:50S ribosomal protein L24, partial [Candidatus Saganbacteria bacterium]|nr:50S ribosomal protein L24 [Candidatus Saganbacteria bacterium]